MKLMAPCAKVLPPRPRCTLHAGFAPGRVPPPPRTSHRGNEPRLRERLSHQGPAIRPGHASLRFALALGLLLLLAGAGWFYFARSERGAPAPESESASPAPAPPAPEFPFQAKSDPLPENIEPVIVPLSMRVEGEYRFQDHLGQVPFEYEPPIHAWRLLELAAPVAEIGWYPSDHPESLKAMRRKPEETTAELGNLYWHKGTARTSKFLGAVRQEMAPALGKRREAFLKLVPRAVSTASWLDAVTTRGLAEMRLRLVAPGDLGALIEAIDALALALDREGRHAALDHLLEAGPGYRPAPAPAPAPATAAEASSSEGPVPAWPGETFDPVFTVSAVPEGDRDLFRFHLALARGDAEAARGALEALPTSPEAAPEAAPGLLARLEEGLEAGLSPEQRDKLAAHFEKLALLLEGHAAPIPERFADWPTERVLDWVRWCQKAHHGVSDPGADALLYLLEERRFEGGDLLPHAVIGAAFRVTKRGEMGHRKTHRPEPARAAALHALVPSLAYPPYPPGRPEAAEDGMLQFNGFEAPIYAWYRFGWVNEDRLGEAALQEIYEGLLGMVEYSIAHCQSEAAAGITGRPGYLTLALDAKWELLGHAHGVERKIEALREMIERAPNLGFRRRAKFKLAETLHHADRHEEAMDVLRPMALGREGARRIPSALWEMGGIADDPEISAAQRAAWLEEALELALEAQEAVEAGHFEFEDEGERARTVQQLGVALRDLRFWREELEARRPGEEDEEPVS